VLVLTLVFTASFAAVGNAGQQSPQWQVAVSTFVSEGDYGSDETTRLVYTSLSVRRTFPRGDLTVRVPWLDVTTDGTVLVFRGVPQPAPVRGGVRPAAMPVAVRHTTSASGVGDVGIVGRYFLVEERGARPALDLTVRLELPTADEALGLGLGTASGEIGLEMWKGIGPWLVGLGTASYTATGAPDDVQVRNPWEYSAGMGAYLGPSVLVSLEYEQWRPVIPGTPIGRDLLASATIRAGRFLRVLASAQLPLSDQAPDFGAGAGLAVRF
jgi:hypothetical protein